MSLPKLPQISQIHAPVQTPAPEAAPAYPQRAPVAAPAPAPVAAPAYPQRAPAPAYAPPTGPPRIEWDKINAAHEKAAVINPGIYRLRVTSSSIGYNPGKRKQSFKTHFVVLESTGDGAQHPPGASVIVIGSFTNAGMAEVKSLVMHAAGYGVTLEDRFSGDPTVVPRMIAAQDAFHRDEVERGYAPGAVMDASYPPDLSQSDPGNTLGIVGKEVCVFVEKGKAILIDGQPNGDHWRRYTWGVASSTGEEESA